MEPNLQVRTCLLSKDSTRRFKQLLSEFYEIQIHSYDATWWPMLCVCPCEKKFEEMLLLNLRSFFHP